MEDDDVIDGLCDFYTGVENAYAKWRDKVITSEQAMTEIAELLADHYSDYSGGAFGNV